VLYLRFGMVLKNIFNAMSKSCFLSYLKNSSKCPSISVNITLGSGACKFSSFSLVLSTLPPIERRSSS
jgi:hypothetical protein